MAFAPAIARVLYNTALGKARQQGSAYDPADEARILRSRNPAITNSYIDFFNLARSAGLAAERGVALRGAGAPPLRTRQHPIDPTLAGAADRFRYRVVVREGQPLTNQYYETLIRVDSPTPMDGDSIRAAAIAIAQAMRGTANESPRARTQQAPTDWVAIVVGAGRQY